MSDTDLDEEKGERTIIPYITREVMTREIRDHLAATTPFERFWTDDWSPDFYRAQARLGLIAVAAPGPEGRGNVLLPELQRAYAVLDWANLTTDRGVRRILEVGGLERKGIGLQIEYDPATVLDWLQNTWDETSWLVPEYRQLVRRLALPEERAEDPGFRILATTLDSHGEPVAGELGYCVGRAYVSLSGFFRRERREWNHYGKLQMVLLALRLQAAGFAFWNLGHPYMEYKTRLGAQNLPRSEFLSRWDGVVDNDVPALVAAGD